MKAKREVQTLLKHAGIRTSPAGDSRVLADALRAAGLTRDIRPARPEPSLWRTIMKSRTTKFATAAVIVAAVLISLSQFNQPVVKAVELSEMTQAMQQTPWMHSTGAAQERGITPTWEEWIGFNAKVEAIAVARGRAAFSRYKEHEKAEYDPNSRTITLSYVDEKEFAPRSSAVQMLESMYKVLKDKDAKIVTRMGDYRGHRVQVQEMLFSSPDWGFPQNTIVLYIDPQTKLLLGSEQKAVKPDGTVYTMACSCDYPKTGPQDIYDLGVPRDARIVRAPRDPSVVDSTPEPGFGKLLEEYNRRRAAAVIDESAALIVTARENGVVTRLEADYKSGSKSRNEYHSIFRPDESPSRFWPKYREQLGSTFDSMLAWTRHYDDPNRGRLDIRLDDGLNYYLVTRNETGTWGKLAKFPGHGGVSTFSALGRPPIRPTGRIIEDDYSRQNKLICVEELSQGRIIGSGRGASVTLPRRMLYYVDPAHDYLCHRQVLEWRKDGAWQENKDWLAGMDPNAVHVPIDEISDEEITSTFQAENGRSYPKTIIRKSTQFYAWTTDVQTTTVTVYLKISPTFPDGLFDRRKLPGQ
jgi:hypothetical protein